MTPTRHRAETEPRLTRVQPAINPAPRPPPVTGRSRPEGTLTCVSVLFRLPRAQTPEGDRTAVASGYRTPEGSEELRRAGTRRLCARWALGSKPVDAVWVRVCSSAPRCRQHLSIRVPALSGGCCFVGDTPARAGGGVGRWRLCTARAPRAGPGRHPGAVLRDGAVHRPDHRRPVGRPASGRAALAGSGAGVDAAPQGRRRAGHP